MQLPRFSAILSSASLIGLAACTVGPDYRPQSASALKVPTQFVAAQGAEPSKAPAPDLSQWWRGFDDPVLTGLVERSLAANLDIQVAGARLRQARALVSVNRSYFLPTIDLSSSTSRDVFRGDDQTRKGISIDASWEADIFGSQRRALQASRADLEAGESDLHFAQLSVAAEVGFTYLDARLAQIRLRIAHENLVSQDETLQIVGWRTQAGLVSGLDQEQARQLRAQTAASIPALEAGYIAAVNRLAVLLGEAPGALSAMIDPPRSIPLAPVILAPIPAEVVQRRPDIRSAERTLAAETARIGVEQAQLYPALRLTGSFSGVSKSFGDALDNGVGSLIGGITAPLFQGGRIRAAIEGQKASTDAAMASYRSIVLVALEEVENALTSVNAAARREQQVLISADAAQNAAIYARSQYRAGLIDFQILLETERSLLSSQDNAASARADRATATVTLYKALGGGWEAAPLPASAHLSAKMRP